MNGKDATTNQSLKFISARVAKTKACRKAAKSARNRVREHQGGIDRDWPHQVALPEAAVVGKNITIIERFCRGLTLCSRRQHFTRDGVEHIVFCFENQLDAGYFQTYFGGESMTPATRSPRYLKKLPSH